MLTKAWIEVHYEIRHSGVKIVVFHERSTLRVEILVDIVNHRANFPGGRAKEWNRKWCHRTSNLSSFSDPFLYETSHVFRYYFKFHDLWINVQLRSSIIACRPAFLFQIKFDFVDPRLSHSTIFSCNSSLRFTHFALIYLCIVLGHLKWVPAV